MANFWWIILILSLGLQAIYPPDSPLDEPSAAHTRPAHTRIAQTRAARHLVLAQKHSALVNNTYGAFPLNSPSFFQPSTPTPGIAKRGMAWVTRQASSSSSRPPDINHMSSFPCIHLRQSIKRMIL